MFWPQTGNVTFYAFSPASNSSVSFDTSTKQLKYTASTAQSSQQDVLYAYTTSSRPSSNTVNLTFNHANAAFSVSAKLAEGCTATVNVSGVKLVNVMPTNTLTVSSGAASASGTKISTDVAINSTTLTTTAATISSSPLMLPPQSVTAWSGTSALANTYLAVSCKVQANDTYVVGSASANGTVYVPMDKTLTKGQDNTVNLIFGSETDNGRSFGRDDSGNRITWTEDSGMMDAVDLGLSVLWGSDDIWGNEGTSFPNDYCNYNYTYDYYNWGCSTDYYDKLPYKSDNQGSDFSGVDDNDCINFTWQHTPYYVGDANGNNRNNASSWSKYTTSGQTLDLSDDIAHKLLGGKWRMPTEAEWQELINNCNWNYDSGMHDHVYVSIDFYTVYGKKEGYTGNSITLHTQGYVDGLSLNEQSYMYKDEIQEGEDNPGGYIDQLYTGGGYYWTSTMGSSPSQARGVVLFNGNKTIGNHDRKLGYRIRPVRDK